MWDFSGQILEAGVWTKLQIFQPGMCTVPGRLPTTERGRKRERGWDRQREGEREKGGVKGNRGKRKKEKNKCVCVLGGGQQSKKKVMCGGSVGGGLWERELWAVREKKQEFGLYVCVYVYVHIKKISRSHLLWYHGWLKMHINEW